MKALLITLLIISFSSILSDTYYPKCSASKISFVDALKSIGEDATMAKRKSIALLNGITDYRGTVTQNTELLNKLKKGILIKSKDGSSTPTPISTNGMMKKLEQNSKYSKKKQTLSIIGTLLLDKGYEPAFVAGVLSMVFHKGNVGMFETSVYKTNPSAKPQYLKYMDNLYNYGTKYSGKCITDVSLSELSKMMEKLKSKNYKEGKFSLGCIQWLGGRTYNLVQLYLQECGNKNKITLDQAISAEGKMIINELKGSYKSIYEDWKNQNSNKNTANAAYNAGSILVKKYEAPSDSKTKAVTVGNTSKDIYTIMTS